MASNYYVKRTALTAGAATAVAESTSELGLQCHLRIVNKGVGPAKARVFVDTTNSVAVADYLEYDAIILPGVPLIIGPLVLPPGHNLYARTDVADCNAVAMGEMELADE